MRNVFHDKRQCAEPVKHPGPIGAVSLARKSFRYPAFATRLGRLAAELQRRDRFGPIP
jgi:hypothetical protein